MPLLLNLARMWLIAGGAKIEPKSRLADRVERDRHEYRHRFGGCRFRMDCSDRGGRIRSHGMTCRDQAPMTMSNNIAAVCSPISNLWRQAAVARHPGGRRVEWNASD